MAHFTSQDTSVMASFPYNGYQTDFDQFDWDWKQNLLFMKSKKGQKGIFIRNEDQLKGLCFQASKGLCNLNTGLLQLEGLAPMKMGNAFLHLNDSILKIESDASIQNLEGSFVIGDLLNRMYTLSAVTFIWNEKTASFVSKGTSFELKIKQEEKAQLVRGKIEVIPREDGLVVRYAWIFPNGDWCFLNYKKGVLRAVSNTGSMDEILLENVEKFKSFRARWL